MSILNLFKIGGKIEPHEHDYLLHVYKNDIIGKCLICKTKINIRINEGWTFER